MKRRNIVPSTLLLAAGPVLFLASDAQAGYYVNPSPTLSVSTTDYGSFVDVSFSGDDYCGRAYYVHGPPFAEVTCSHTVFVGFWQLGPPPVNPADQSGVWATSVTLQSTAGGLNAVPSDVGKISGNLTIHCGNASGTVYAYDLDQGTLITGLTINPPTCPIGRLP